MDRFAYRVIDANLNRAREGIRVVEEICRFILEDKKSTQCLKQIRHQISRTIKEISPDYLKLLSARKADRDIGAFIKERDEFKRKNYLELLKINLQRTKEALRALEEFSKLLNPPVADSFEKIRFKIYSLEKDILLNKAFLNNLSYPVSFSGSQYASLLNGLYVLLDRSFCVKKTHLQIAQEIIAGGAKIIQLREKNLADAEFLKVARRLRKITPDNQVLFIVNDRLDIALSADADGVHLGQDDMPLKEARKMLGRDKIIGVSTHNLAQAIKAEKEGADYISVGPIFSTKTKPDYKQVGLELIQKVKKEIKIPFFAIGGINLENIDKVIRAGAKGIAVLSAIISSKNISSTTCKFRQKIK